MSRISRNRSVVAGIKMQPDLKLILKDRAALCRFILLTLCEGCLLCGHLKQGQRKGIVPLAKDIGVNERTIISFMRGSQRDLNEASLMKIEAWVWRKINFLDIQEKEKEDVHSND